jgi:chromosome partitioning protein
MAGSVIMFANQKGGVGKTTSVFEIGYLLSKKGKNVLMIDLDAQVNLTEITGAEYEKGKTVYDAVTANAPFSDCIVNIRDGLDLIPGSRKMLSQHFVTVDDLYLLQDGLQYIYNFKPYDYILIDVGPEAGQMMTMAMIASDYIVAVTSLAPLGYSGVVQLCADLGSNRKHFANFNVKPLGILVNNVKRTNVAGVNREQFLELAREFGAEPFKNEVPGSCKADECKMLKEPLAEYAPQSPLVQAFSEITDEITERIGA